MWAFPKSRFQLSKVADATAYTSGDHIANSLTAAQVVPLTFPLPGDTQFGRILGARAVAKPASGNLVVTGFDFDLLLFRPATDIPFAAGAYPADNAALALPVAAMRELIGIFAFVNGAWRNPAGGVTAGASGMQQIAASRQGGFNFDLTDFSSKQILGVLQAKGTWTPTAIAQTIDIDLEVETL